MKIIGSTALNENPFKMSRKTMKLFKSLYNMTFGKLIRELKYRKRLKELRKRDPFIYK